MWKMMESERPVIFGDGSQTRDLTFVKDVVEANMLAAEKRGEINGRYFNIGTGVETSFKQVVDELNKVLGTDIEPEYVENPIDNYVDRTKADISQARELLGYEPEHSFREGLEKTADYYRRHL
jgi:UDP-glucose 4-epimerase